MFSSQQMTIKKEKQKVYSLRQILLFKGKRSYHNATITSYELLTSDLDAQIAIMREVQKVFHHLQHENSLPSI